MKIIDFEKKGNLVRFYLGEDSLEKWWGDGFSGRPYEHNAGSVYEEYVSSYVDIVFPFTWDIHEPEDDWHYNGNSPFSKEDFINRKAPCIIAIPEKITENAWGTDYSEYLGSEEVYKFYYGDKVDLDEYNIMYLFEKLNAYKSIKVVVQKVE